MSNQSTYISLLVYLYKEEKDGEIKYEKREKRITGHMPQVCLPIIVLRLFICIIMFGLYTRLGDFKYTFLI